jgi:alkyl hydroperoxide reductase subunit AhpF
MKTIRKGDKVRAYLHSHIHGVVVDIVVERSHVWTLEGTLATTTFCVVQLENGTLIKVKSSDLYIEY